MRKRVGDLKGGRSVIPEGDYKLKVCDFQIKDGKAGPYVVVDLMVVGPAHQTELFGQHTEIGFSTVGVALKPWLLALGMSEDDSIELEDKDELESILRTHCKDSIIFAEVTKTKQGEYENNTIEKPWVNVSASELGANDYDAPTDGPNF